MKSTAKMNNAQLNNELSSEEIIAIGKKAYEEATAITWRQAEVGRTLTQNDKIALVDDKTLVANFSKNRNFSYGFYLTKFEKVLENKGFVRNNDT